MVDGIPEGVPFEESHGGATCAARFRANMGVRIGMFGLVLPLPSEDSTCFPPHKANHHRLNDYVVQRRLAQLRGRINPEWIDAGPERDILFVANHRALDEIEIGVSPVTPPV